MTIASYKKEFIHFMVRSGVLIFGDFTTKSGRKTPYFINTGNYNTGEQAEMLGKYYATCFTENQQKGLIPADVKVLFGPAYKGIPLAVTTSIALNQYHHQNLHYCFDRKEEKDHGEGGSLIGYKPQAGEKVVIVEDVITAGTALRQTLPLLEALDAKAVGVLVSVNRMERGKGELTAIAEIKRDFDLPVFPIVTVKDILETLYQQPLDGVTYIDDELRDRMLAYWDAYCVMGSE